MSTFYPCQDAIHPESATFCDNCSATWPLSALQPITDAEQRLHIGEYVPAGQCPDETCGACCHLVEPEPNGEST